MSLLNVLKGGERLEKPDNQACHDDMLALLAQYNQYPKLMTLDFSFRMLHLCSSMIR